MSDSIKIQGSKYDFNLTIIIFQSCKCTDTYICDQEGETFKPETL